MTTNHTLAERGERVEVTKADREAAARQFVRRYGGTAWQHIEVMDDDHPLVQSFAAHRSRARKDAFEEAAKVAEGDGTRWREGTCYAGGRHEAAQAIRALSTQPHTNGET